MKAVVLYGPKNVAIGDMPIPEMQSTYVKVKVEYCGICGSDYHKVSGKKNTHPVRYPVPLGHEMSGIVCEVGCDVNHVKIGDRVTVDPNWSCGKCDACKAGKPSFCHAARGVVKGMAEFVVCPEENVYRLPDSLSLRDAALAEPLACCLRGMDLLDVKAGESVALVGFGAIGAIMLQLLKNSGAAEIAVIEYDATKEQSAKALGATAFIPSTDSAALKAYASEHNVDKVIECVGRASAQQTALDIAGYGATVVMFGVSDSAETMPISFYEAFTKELTIKTSFINPHTTARAVRMLASGLLKTDAIIYKELTMEEAAEEFMAPNLCRFGKLLVKINAK